MKKRDLRSYDKEQLSLIVLNDNTLFRMFYSSAKEQNWDKFINDLRSYWFHFTEEQERTLYKDWSDQVLCVKQIHDSTIYQSLRMALINK